MKIKKVILINRAFWPDSDIPGLALLNLSEELSIRYTTYVLTQSKRNLIHVLNENQRCKNVILKQITSLTDSSSSILWRVIESIQFSLWVFIKLIEIRPHLIYVATDPPIVVPFLVAIYKKFSKAKYIYHLQDIHPEATSLVVHLNKYFLTLLKAIDNFTIRNSSKIVTLSEDMANYLRDSRQIKHVPNLILNPSITFIRDAVKISNSVVYCGNLGRMQEVPLLLDSIDDYLKSRGNLTFTFIGAGIYKQDIIDLTKKWPSKIFYKGYLPLESATKLMQEHQYGLLSINTNVLRFAFPSKASAYVRTGCSIIAICNSESSLGKWVVDNNYGTVVGLNKEDIIKSFFLLENKSLSSCNYSFDDKLTQSYSIENFVKRFIEIFDNIL